jgi:hypothetical protein
VTADHYRPAPELSITVQGARTARRHFAAEYGAARAAHDPAPDVCIDVRFAGSLPRGVPSGGHKTVRWAVAVGPLEGPLTAAVVLSGAPRSFALSLVQGFVVEPLASLAAARTGQVLLPAAALADASAAVVVLGRSRSGKTSVVARAVAAGHPALGDDQVLVDVAGQVRSWPRRLRVYPDLRSTAPSAVSALPARKRLRLTALAAVAKASRGWVAPSLPLAWRDLGGEARPGPLPVARVVVVERGGSSAGVETSALETSAVVDLARQILREQRVRLRALLGPDADDALRLADEQERATLHGALSAVPAELWTVPSHWPAPVAVTALAERLHVSE